MTRVVVDVSGDAGEPKHATALNINHSYLGYWQRPADPDDGHFNFAYGYNYRDCGVLILGDGGNLCCPGQARCVARRGLPRRERTPA
jgi:hypothetical protein